MERFLTLDELHECSLKKHEIYTQFNTAEINRASGLSLQEMYNHPHLTESENLISVMNLSHPTVDLRMWDTPVKNQIHGTCAVHSTIGCLENTVRRHTGRTYDFSEQYIWSKGIDFYLHRAAEVVCQHYSIPEHYWVTAEPWPRQGYENQGIAAYTGWHWIDNDNAIKQSLNRGMPVVIAPEMHVGLYSGMTRNNPIVDINWPINDCHAMACVGYYEDYNRFGHLGGGLWICKNSWGPGYADNGYLYLPFSLRTRRTVWCIGFHAQLNMAGQGIINLAPWSPGRDVSIPSPNYPVPNPNPYPPPPPPRPVIPPKPPAPPVPVPKPLPKFPAYADYKITYVTINNDYQVHLSCNNKASYEYIKEVIWKCEPDEVPQLKEQEFTESGAKIANKLLRKDLRVGWHVGCRVTLLNGTIFDYYLKLTGDGTLSDPLRFPEIPAQPVLIATQDSYRIEMLEYEVVDDTIRFKLAIQADEDYLAQVFSVTYDVHQSLPPHGQVNIFNSVDNPTFQTGAVFASYVSNGWIGFAEVILKDGKKFRYEINTPRWREE